VGKLNKRKINWRAEAEIINSYSDFDVPKTKRGVEEISIDEALDVET
jgi:hypothetical protein